MNFVGPTNKMNENIYWLTPETHTKKKKKNEEEVAQKIGQGKIFEIVFGMRVEVFLIEFFYSPKPGVLNSIQNRIDMGASAMCISSSDMTTEYG